MRPICVPCRRFFHPTHTGISFIEGMPIGGDALPGTAEPEKWKPFKLWHGDEFTCRGCNAVVIVGVARAPISEHFRPTFADDVKKWEATIQINDC